MGVRFNEIATDVERNHLSTGHKLYTAGRGGYGTTACVWQATMRDSSWFIIVGSTIFSARHYR